MGAALAAGRATSTSSRPRSVAWSSRRADHPARSRRRPPGPTATATTPTTRTRAGRGSCSTTSATASAGRSRRASSAWASTRVDIAYIHDPDDHWAAAIAARIRPSTGCARRASVRAIGVGMNQSAMLARFVARDRHRRRAAGRPLHAARPGGARRTCCRRCAERGVAVHGRRGHEQRRARGSAAGRRVRLPPPRPRGRRRARPPLGDGLRAARRAAAGRGDAVPARPPGRRRADRRASGRPPTSTSTRRCHAAADPGGPVGRAAGRGPHPGASRRRSPHDPPVIDAHHHFWDPARADYPWMTAELAAIRRPFGMGDLAPELSTAGVDATILVQARISLAETREFLATAAATPLVAGVVGWADLTSPASPTTSPRCGPARRRPARRDPPPGPRRARPGVAAARRRRARPRGRRGAPGSSTTCSSGPASCRRRSGGRAAMRRTVRFVVDHLAKPPIRDRRMSSRGRAARAVRRAAEHRGASCPGWSPRRTGRRGRWTTCGRSSRRGARRPSGPASAVRSDWPVCLLAGVLRRPSWTPPAELTAGLSERRASRRSSAGRAESTSTGCGS